MSLAFESYRAFAPAGWRPPPDHTEAIRVRMRSPGAWALMAEVAGEPAGHVSLLPARGDEGRTAHLWQLFVRPPWWGTGLADRLHEAWLQHARAAGWRQGRLGTPAAHMRARRFYARRGWRVEGPPEVASDFGLALVVLRRDL